MNNEKNITKNDMIFFQNDILTDLKKLELQLNRKIASLNQTLISKSNEYELKFSTIVENISSLISQITARKYDNERIEELISLKSKFGDQINENQNRITLLERSLEDSNYKYDKIILDNLQVPGIIGISCKFKNCKVFLEHVFNELSLNEKYKEQEESALKLFNEKLDINIFKIENEFSKIKRV